MTENKNNWQHAGEVRYWGYSFLALCFYEIPQQEKFQPFYEGNILKQAGDENIIHQLADCLEQMKDYTPEDWRKMRAEYLRIFPESGPMLVHPWESVYRNREHVLFDEHTLAVQDCMHNWGLTLAAEERIPADHIGLECSFLASLIAKAEKDLDQEDWAGFRKNYQAQQSFLQEHLQTWASQFSKDLEKAAILEFYKVLAVFLPFWLNYDRELLTDICGQLSVKS
ncbi:MAG: molecular chaperone TorD family protein [Selenomonas sp.]|uniref:TorD/DmsD family molecular chaperone n=1 Tax=Selenomonas sp. TaxID=2053611 RepID=UPI0025F197AD|nr:molecular chaperone TorD family protein [Selenomonas sp.]MCR5758590.1 molecular chaperone TorD family protein [Selenomonas sp.]